MNMIFAIDKNWSIGNKGELLFRIPEDLKRFKRITEENIVIMGRKTLESLPGGKPLENRINIVLTKNKNYKKEKVKIVNSIEELDILLENINPEKRLEEFLIGGGEIVEQLIHRCTKAYITRVSEEVDKVDTKIPDLDRNPEWKLIEESEQEIYENLKYKYLIYRRVY